MFTLDYCDLCAASCLGPTDLPQPGTALCKCYVQSPWDVLAYTTGLCRASQGCVCELQCLGANGDEASAHMYIWADRVHISAGISSGPGRDISPCASPFGVCVLEVHWCLKAPSAWFSLSGLFLVGKRPLLNQQQLGLCQDSKQRSEHLRDERR